MIIREAIIREADDCPKERTTITPNDEGRRTAFLAQLDRAIVFEAIGCKFDSCRTLVFLYVRSFVLQANVRHGTSQRKIYYLGNLFMAMKRYRSCINRLSSAKRTIEGMAHLIIREADVAQAKNAAIV